MSASEPRKSQRTIHSAHPAGLETKRFLIVTGKGGVGKTTVCAAEAVALANKGKRVLVCMCNAKERLSTMLGAAPIGSDVVPVAPNVWAVNMDPENALHEYGMMALRSETLFKLLFDNKYVRAFFRAVPGMQEWTMLGKAWWHTTETRADESPVYDVVVLDAPATGHGLDMLRVPKVILDVVPPGVLRRDAERAWKLFQDPKQCAVVLVTLPEEMAITETIELARAIDVELELPIGKVVVNSVLPPLFSREERKALEDTGAPVERSSPSNVVFASARARAMRERVQAESLSRLSSELPISPSFLPQLFRDAATPEAIHELARRLG
ncbi:MAG: ArsA family ATPase [Polyangiaceae bacterium]|nr:ArsA family ATPase [Polyangiaceae bacterium]